MGVIENIVKGNMTEEELLEYVTSNDLNVAIAVASSLFATESILDIAARDKDKEVRLAVVKNACIGKKTLRYLLSDSEEEISILARDRLEDRENEVVL